MQTTELFNLINATLKICRSRIGHDGKICFMMVLRVFIGTLSHCFEDRLPPLIPAYALFDKCIF